MMTVPVRILTVRNSVSTETVRKQYGNSTETLRNSVSTPYCVVHGYPRKARESDFCMYGGRRDQQGCVTVMQGCVTDALRFDHSVAAPRKATEVLNISKHSWPLPDHHGSPGIMKDHDGLFQYRSRYRTNPPRLEIKKDREVI